jgi:mannose-6-phosphate isomerase-like protein (cupin superfamily)
MPVVNKTNAEHYVWGEVCEGWRLVAREDLSVIQERIPPGRGEVRHYHERARQLFFVLQGALEIEVDGGVSHLGPGDALEIAPTRRHRVWNAGAADATFLVVSAPTTQGDRVNVADGEGKEE